jgi:DNA-binding XRE family transcriptional regulator
MYLLDLNHINELRKQHKISKRKLGKLMGYRSQTSVYYFLETGTVRSKIKVLALCKIFDCLPEGLLVYPKKLKGCIY